MRLVRRLGSSLAPLRLDVLAADIAYIDANNAVDVSDDVWDRISLLRGSTSMELSLILWKCIGELWRSELILEVMTPKQD